MTLEEFLIGLLNEAATHYLRQTDYTVNTEIHRKRIACLRYLSAEIEWTGGREASC